TYFYSLGPEIGVNALHDFTKQFGFGQITGIDLEGERRGVLPSTEWKRKAYKDKDRQRWGCRVESRVARIVMRLYSLEPNTLSARRLMAARRAPRPLRWLHYSAPQRVFP
ncbi:hypothetical protein AD428_11715, partial [Achromobacter sp. DMS1]